MGDPLSVAASVAGLVSLGVQVSQSLIEFYLSYKGQDVTVDRTTQKLEKLSSILHSLDEALKERKFEDTERTLIKSIESSIASCEDPIRELEEELQKVSPFATKGFVATIKNAGRRLSYPFRQSTFQRLDEDVREILENLSLALDVLQLRDSARVQNNEAEIKALLELVRTSQISQIVRDWLKAPDAIVNYHDACAKRHPASGLWLVKGPAFNDWLENESSFLWLNGFAGCGKSVLSSTAIQYAFRHRRSNPSIGLAFFYFAFNDESKQDVSGMLRAVLLQLSNQLKDDHAVLARLYEHHRSGVPPVPALLDSLQQIVRSFEQVYIIIDALDESPRGRLRESVLDVLEQVRKWPLRTLHILVTSRDEPDIRERLEPSADQDISLKNAGVDEDIAAFISQQLERRPALRKWSSYNSRIKEALTVGAKGV